MHINNLSVGRGLDLPGFTWICSRSWNQAEQQCQDIFGQLASVTSDTIHQYVLEGMKRRDLDFVWLGGTDKDKEGTWKWTDGSPFEFTGWRPKQPDNYKGREDCLHMYRLGKWTDNRGKWNDLRCDTKLHFLCAQKIC